MKMQMKIIVPVLLLCIFSCELMEKKSAKADLESPSGKFSYAMGLEMGGYLKQLGTDIDINSFIQGVKDTLEGTPRFTSQQAMEIKQSHYQQIQEDRKKKNKEEGEAFLAENKEKHGVITTESGLQYTVLTEGMGDKPTLNDKVSVHYTGTLLDGTVFDSSHKRGQPATFNVKGVIPGWTEVLQLMNVGSKFKVFIPSDLAYGERGAGRQIGPNATLIFEMELLEIKK
jgi:FKBP-type peptidyl-prolyl cis-trans isomerase